MRDNSQEIIGLYRRHALAWTGLRAREAGHFAEAAWVRRFCGLLPARAAVLDLGCGSGEPIARALLAHGCAVTGVDAAPEMIALCRAGLPGGHWHEADMRGLALGRQFDGVLAWDSFFHLRHDDQRKMFAVFQAHAGPGAALMFTSGISHGVAMGELEGEPLYHASLDEAEYKTLLDRHGFDPVAHVVEDPTCRHRTIWLAKAR